MNTWEAGIFQNMMSQHADLAVPDKDSIDEVDESQPSQPRRGACCQALRSEATDAPNHQARVFTNPRAKFKDSRSMEQHALHLPQMINATVSGSAFQLELDALEPAQPASQQAGP